MRFGEVPTGQAIGSMLAHSTKLAGRSLPKGHLITALDVADLLEAQVASLIVGTLEGGDLLENLAARILAEAIGTSSVRVTPATTGRVNFYARESGVFWPNPQAVNLFNSVDPSITLATLSEGVSVNDGEMIATIKIIPLAVPSAIISSTINAVGPQPVLEIRPYARHDVFLISTELPTLKRSVIEKTARILASRLELSRSLLVRELPSEHRPELVAQRLQEALLADGIRPRIIVIFGASAVTDERDVIPQAIRLAGGQVIRVGMPVDPGNLLVLGELNGVPVIGAPGCARSPKENGFDWVLRRLLTGESPYEIDIGGMGVGGLLKEISARPSPRQAQDQHQEPITVAAVLLAAGTSSRMGGGNKHKLLAEFDGIPLVVRTASAALASRAAGVIAVTGHGRDDIETALAKLPLHLCHNPAYRSGISGSLACGVSEAIERKADGVLVLLADMPNVSSSDINALIDAFVTAKGLSVVRATGTGKRGNPVIIPRKLYSEILALQGDVGAKHVVESPGLDVIDVDIGLSAHLDVDTPEALMAAGGTFESRTLRSDVRHSN